MLQNFEYKRREPIFHVWGREEKGGNQNFPKILSAYGNREKHREPKLALKIYLGI